MITTWPETKHAYKMIFTLRAAQTRLKKCVDKTFILRHVYPQSDHGAASEVDDGVDSDHFQVQLYFPGPFDGACHHQGGTDGACLLWTEPGIPVRESLTGL